MNVFTPIATIAGIVVIVYQLSRLERKLKQMSDKIDDLLTAIATLKTAADTEVAALQALRDELTTAGSLTPDQQARLDTAISNIGAATAELTGSATPPATA